MHPEPGQFRLERGERSCERLEGLERDARTAEAGKIWEERGSLGEVTLPTS